MQLVSPLDLASSPRLAAAFSQHAYLVTKDRRRLIVYERPGLWDDHTTAYLELNLEGRWHWSPSARFAEGWPKRITDRQFADYISKGVSPTAPMSPADALVAAAESGENGNIRSLLNQDVPIDGQDRRGWTALTIAVQAGQDATIELLIAHGADLNVRDNVGKGRTALMRACSAGNPSLVDTLLLHGADFRVKLDDGGTALLDALPFPQIVLRLIAAGAPVDGQIESRLFSEWSPLIAACYGGYTETARILIEHGADLRRDLAAALDLAARNGHADVIRMLVSSGVQADQRTLESSLLSAYAHPEAMSQLLKAGADVNARCGECNGRTTVMISAINGCPEAVHFLISAGANLNLKDNKGHTALDLVSASMSSERHSLLEEKRFSEITDSLRKSGARESGTKVVWPETW